MDKLFVRKDVYEELLEKGFGKKDYSKLTKKKITDKNGHTRTVFVRNGEQPAAQKQPKAQEGLSDEKRAKYEEMLEKVKAGSDENALFVQGKMLNKKEAIAHLEGKLGKKPENSDLEENNKIMDEFKGDPLENVKKLNDELRQANNKKVMDDFNNKIEKIKNDTLKRIEELKKDPKENREEKKQKKEPVNSITNKFSDKEKKEIYKLFEDSDFTKELDSKMLFNLPNEAGELIIKKMPHGSLKSKLYSVCDEYNRDNFKDARDYLSNLPQEVMGQLYKDYKENLKNKPSKDDMIENYLDAKNEAREDIGENNKINTLSKKIKFTPEEMKAIKSAAEKINYKKGKEQELINAIEDRNIFSALRKKNMKVWEESGQEQKTFDMEDLIREKIKSLNGNFEI